MTPVEPPARGARTPSFRLQGTDLSPPEQRLREMVDQQLREEIGRRPLSVSSNLSADSVDSTIPSEGDRSAGSGLPVEPPSVLGASLCLRGAGCPRASPEESLASAHRCAALVERECGFLRLRGYWLNPETRMRAKRRGVVAMIRFYVQGLPWAKRAKWLQPLLWSVVAVLQRHACAITVRGGDLYVGLDTGGSVRVDFAAARD